MRGCRAVLSLAGLCWQMRGGRTCVGESRADARPQICAGGSAAGRKLPPARPSRQPTDPFTLHAETQKSEIRKQDLLRLPIECRPRMLPSPRLLNAQILARPLQDRVSSTAHGLIRPWRALLASHLFIGPLTARPRLPRSRAPWPTAVASLTCSTAWEQSSLPSPEGRTTTKNTAAVPTTTTTTTTPTARALLAVRAAVPTTTRSATRTLNPAPSMHLTQTTCARPEQNTTPVPKTSATAALQLQLPLLPHNTIWSPGSRARRARARTPRVSATTLIANPAGRSARIGTAASLFTALPVVAAAEAGLSIPVKRTWVTVDRAQAHIGGPYRRPPPTLSMSRWKKSRTHPCAGPMG